MTEQVTQADRDAADAWRRDFGDKDDFLSLAQAFARHRRASTAPMLSDRVEAADGPSREVPLTLPIERDGHSFYCDHDLRTNGDCTCGLAALRGEG